MPDRKNHKLRAALARSRVRFAKHTKTPHRDAAELIRADRDERDRHDRGRLT
jgi:hypothetical protein